MPADRSSVSKQGNAEAGQAESAGTPPLLSMPKSAIAFAANVTPGTFNDPSPPPPPLVLSDDPVDSMLFPPQEDDPSSLRKTHGRKKPENHIPRPPNAFILFRSAFIKNRHVSTGVETNHSTLSKIVGLTWQNLPNEEREVWHRKAKLAEEQHRQRFPQYAFRPLHKRKDGAKRKVREVGPKDHKRCAKIAEFLVQGKKGKELDDAMKEFDKHHIPEIVTRFEAPITEETFQASSSAQVRVKEEEVDQLPKSRASSVRSARRSNSAAPCIPSPLSTEILPLPPLSPPSSSPQDPSYLSIPSFDQFSFGGPAKDDQTFDFSSFSFTSAVPSSDSLYQFDYQSQGIHPLDNTFIQPPQHSVLSQPRSHLVLPPLLTVNGWPTSHSPSDSPSTNAASMPTTPAGIGTTSMEQCPVQSASDSIVQPKPQHYSELEHFSSYHDMTPTYDGPIQVAPLGCGYSAIHMQQSEPDFQSVNLDYSAFMPALPSYSL